MAILTALAIGALALGAYSAYEGYQARQDAKESSAKSYQEQLKAQAEQKAMNAQMAANEQRKQIREERVRRAKILQASVNSGTEFGSGEAGAVSGLGTGLAANIGFNSSRVDAANRISDYNQTAAGYQFQAQQAAYDAQNANSLFSLSTSIFSASGGFGAFKTPKATGWNSQG